MSETYPIRPIEPAEFPAFLDLNNHAFNSDWPLDSFAAHESLIFEFDRSVAAFDTDQVVGTGCGYSLQMSVPGGTVPTGGISAVAVLPTYRRRGIMTALMKQLLTDSAARGECLTALFAAESEIYGRLGFGCASEQLRVSIQRGDGALISPVFPAETQLPRLQIAKPRQVLAELASVYAEVAASRPGMPARGDGWWQSRTDDSPLVRDGDGAMRCLIARDAGGPRGYALYSTKPNWGDYGLAACKLNVHELLATDPGATIALWTDLLTRDLTGEVSAGPLPVDDVLLQLMAGRRRARAQLGDGLWIRLMDLPGALSQRRYAAGLDVVLEVTDPLLPANAGRWHLRADCGGTGSCERTSKTADILLPIQALSAAYLGGTRLVSLAAAGQLAARRPELLAELSTAMSWDPAPWCPMIF